MSSRSQIVSRLVGDRASRESYLRAKLNQIIPSQIKALRLRTPWTQKELGDEVEMKQARISAVEKPGETAFTLETLIRLAAAFRVGLQVKFIPYSEMAKWNDDYCQDDFSVTPIEEDEQFLNPQSTTSVRAEIFTNVVFGVPGSALLGETINVPSTPGTYWDEGIAAYGALNSDNLVFPSAPAIALQNERHTESRCCA